MTAERWLWPGSTLIRVVDGDSLIVKLRRDLGFDGYVIFDQHIRLNRINCPPGSTPDGKAATAAVLTSLAAGPFHVETLKPYKYGGSYMAEVTLPDGRNLADLLVEQGHGVWWDGQGPRPGG